MTTLRVGVFNHHVSALDDRWLVPRSNAQVDALVGAELDVLISTGVRRWFDHDRRVLHAATRELCLHPMWADSRDHGTNVIIWVNLARMVVLAEHHHECVHGRPAYLRAQVHVDGAVDPLWLLGVHDTNLQHGAAAQRPHLAHLAGQLVNQPALIAGTIAENPSRGPHPTRTPAQAHPAETSPRARTPHEVPGAEQTVADLLEHAGFVDADSHLDPAPPSQRTTAFPRGWPRRERIYLSVPVTGALLDFEVRTNHQLGFDRALAIAVLQPSAAHPR